MGLLPSRFTFFADRGANSRSAAATPPSLGGVSRRFEKVEDDLRDRLHCDLRCPTMIDESAGYTIASAAFRAVESLVCLLDPFER